MLTELSSRHQQAFLELLLCETPLDEIFRFVVKCAEESLPRTTCILRMDGAAPTIMPDNAQDGGWHQTVHSRLGHPIGRVSLYPEASVQSAPPPPLLSTIAELAALAYDRHQLSSERECRRLTALALRTSEIQSRTMPLSDMLQRCAEALVQELHLAFARIWLLDHTGQELVLAASAGLSTNLHGTYSRVPVATSLKIGRMVEDRQPRLTNQVQQEAWINEPDWAKREALVSYAGYPLIAEDRVVGVMAMFGRYELSDQTLQSLAGVAGGLAQAIVRNQAEQERQASLYKLGERVKELTLLHETASLLEHNESPAELLQSVVSLIPAAWQYPDVTAARIQFAGHDYATARFRETPWGQAAEARLSTGQAVRLQVVYLEARPPADEGPFLREERRVLESLAEMLRNYVEGKDVEAAWQERVERFRLIVKATNDALWDWHFATESVWWNDGVRTLFGYADAGIKPVAWWYDHIHPEDRARVLAGIHTAINGGQTFWRDEYRYLCADGHYAEISDRGYVVRDAAGRAIRMVGAMQDITDRKLAETALLASEEFNRRIIQSSHDCIMVLDLDEKVLLISDSGQRAMDIAKVSSYCGTPYIEFWEDQHRAAVRAALKAAAAGGTGRFIAFCPTVTVEPKWWDVIITPIVGADGSPTKLLAVSRDITEQRQVEEQLEQLLESLTIAQRISHAGVWDWHLAENQAPYVSPEYRDLYGLSLEEHMSYEKWLTLVHPEDRPWLEAYGRKVFQGTDSEYRVEFRILHPERGERWLAGLGRVERDAAGLPVRFTGTNLDITDRKRAEADLRAAYDTFRHLVDHSPFGIYAVDADFRLVQVSAGAQNIFRNVHPLLGRDFAEVLRIIWSEPFASEAIGRFRHTLETGDPYHAPSTVEQRHDIDKIEAYDWKIERVTLPDGRLGVVCHFYDLSERQRYEGALRESESFYRQTLESIPGMTFTTRPDGYCDYQSQQWVDYTGVPMSEHLGGGWLQLLHPDDQPRAKAAWQAAVEERDQYDVEFRVRRRDGVYEWFKEQARPIRDAFGNIVRWFGTAVKIDDLKRAESELRTREEQLLALSGELEHLVQERTEKLVQSQERLRALATELSLTEQRERQRLASELHDHLQQLLVLGKLKLGQGKKVARAMPVCEKAMNDVDDILAEALTYTRTLVAELSPPVLRDHGLGASLRWLGDYMRKHDMTVIVTLPKEDHPVLPEEQLVLLFQSVRELLMNSWKYAGTGQATVTMERQPHALRIEVCDQGKGFRMAESGMPTELSSKFGLFSIRERMKTLGGSFHIHSAPGEGTRGVLEIPLKLHDVPGSGIRPEQNVTGLSVNETVAPSLSPDPLAMASSRVRVLLVDDHAMMRQGLRSVLDSYPDMEVVAEAADGEEAVRAVDRLHPSVVIMDINMPKMNGIDATAHIKAKHPGILVIGLSLNAGGDNRDAMLRAGAELLMTKEAAVEQLHDAILEAVKKSTSLV